MCKYFFSHSTLPVLQQGAMSCATPVTAVTSATPVSLKNLVNLVAARILCKWMYFGVQLDFSYEDLKTYPSDDHEQCFIKLFSSWKSKGSPPYTWETVVDVLESPGVNEKELAKSIRKQCCGSR